MVVEILKETKIPFKRSRYNAKPLPSTYIVYMDDRSFDGADAIGCAVPGTELHQITIELYESKPDDKAEEAIESALIKRGISWEFQDRIWLENEQKYQVIYEFNYTTKRR